MPWLAAAVGLVVTLWAFYPGYMSQDSAAQYLQARTSRFDTQHPPVMAMIWQQTDRVVPGPGGIFALFAVTYWVGLALVVASKRRRSWEQVLGIFAIGWWPPMIGLLAHVWKDVGLLAAFLLASGLLARERRHPSRLLLLLALGAIALGAGFRHNGLAAALPFMPYLAVRCVRTPSEAAVPKRLRILAVAVIATLITIAIAKSPEYLPNVERRSLWPTTALWDLAAVSVEERRILIPESLQREGLTLPDIESNFSPFTNTTTFRSGRIRSSLLEPYDTTQNRDLLHAWLALPFQHPAAYWRHRFRITGLLFGSGGQGRPSYLVLQPEYQQLADNPPVVPNRTFLNKCVLFALEHLIRTPLFGGWLYLLLATLVVAVCIIRRQASLALAATIAASGLCYALPLIVIAGAADFRYLSWLVGASLVATWTVYDSFTGPDRER